VIDLAVTFEINLTPEAIEAAVQRGHERAVVEIGQLLASVARRTISTGVDPWGEAWAPLDPDSQPGQLGVRTGAMLASIYSTPTEPTAGVTRAEVNVGAWYAKFFQGKRPILPLTYDRGFTARGRRSRSRRDSVDMPPDLLAQCIEIDLHHVQTSIDQARAAARSAVSTAPAGVT